MLRYPARLLRTMNVTMLVPDPVNPCDPTQLVATQVGLANNFQTTVGLPVVLRRHRQWDHRLRLLLWLWGRRELLRL